MAASLIKKIEGVMQLLERRFGRARRQEFLPPPSSAEVEAALAVATKNSELVAAAVLGLHGPPEEGLEAARRLLNCCVDWNEVRVAGRESLAAALGHDPRAEERVTLLQRFLESFFLRQRNMNLECLVGLKTGERRQFLSDLEVFSRDELAALLLTCFGHEVFPPAEPIRRVLARCGLIRQKTTVLQMAKLLEDALDADQMLQLYSGLYAVALKTCHEEKPECVPCALRSRCAYARHAGKGSRG
jgi:endonuclease III